MVVKLKLLEVMAKRNMRTIQDAADFTGLSRKTISEILDPNKSKMGIKMETIVKICSKFECNIGDLIQLEDEGQAS